MCQHPIMENLGEFVYFDEDGLSEFNIHPKGLSRRDSNL